MRFMHFERVYLSKQSLGRLLVSLRGGGGVVGRSDTCRGALFGGLLQRGLCCSVYRG